MINTKASNGEFGVVIPTLGDRGTILKVLESLKAQNVRPIYVVIVNQGPKGVLETLKSVAYPFVVEEIRCLKGLARARNAGLAVLPKECGRVMFLDDDVTLEPSFLEIASRNLLQADFMSGALRTQGVAGARINFPRVKTTVSLDNVWTSTIESTCCFRSSYFEVVGVFDERLGLGAGTLWGSAEGTELLVRGLKVNLVGVFDPSAVALELSEGLSTISTSVRLERVQSYARGTGFVFGKHYPLHKSLLLIARSIARVVINAASWGQLSVSLRVLSGRFEGVRGGRIDRARD